MTPTITNVIQVHTATADHRVFPGSRSLISMHNYDNYPGKTQLYWYNIII